MDNGGETDASHAVGNGDGATTAERTLDRRRFVLGASASAAVVPAISVIGAAPAYAQATSEPCDMPDRLLVAGDSWANRLAPYLSNELQTPDRLVVNLGNEGAEASEYANDTAGYTTSLANALQATGCGANVVALSLGGNDIRDTYLANGQSAFDDIASDLVTTIDRLVVADPNVKIWLTGYDILNFAFLENPVCWGAALIFAGGTSPAVVNAILSGLDQMYASVAASRPSNVCYQSSLGTLQGMPGNPDLNNWSPANHVSSDCIHLTNSGHTLFAAQLATYL